MKPVENTVLNEKSDLISVTVKVTNTGNVTGKDAVQLYWKAPYEARKKKLGLISPLKHNSTFSASNVLLS